MATTDPIPELDARFSSTDATARPWSDVKEVIERAEIFWLSTVRTDGRPHVTPLPAIWLDGALHFCTGSTEQKARNLASNPRCVLTTGTSEFRAGLDVVVEGEAEPVTDERRLRDLAAQWKRKLDWTFEVFDGAFREPKSETAGQEFDAKGVANVIAVSPTKVLAFGKGEPFPPPRCWRSARESRSARRGTDSRDPAGPRIRRPGHVTLGLALHGKNGAWWPFVEVRSIAPVFGITGGECPEDPASFVGVRGRHLGDWLRYPPQMSRPSVPRDRRSARSALRLTMKRH